jgi:citrate lyase subunit beta/citryl-CoA lyase
MSDSRKLRAMTNPLMRSKLFVPGARPELFAKALASAADALSFDLEDAVPEAGKVEARARVGEFVQSSAARDCAKLIIVRINAPGSAHFTDDMNAVARSGVTLINLPKCESAADILAAVAALEHAQAANRVDQPIRLLANIETPKALRNAVAIASAHPRVAGLQLGLGDLFEPLGIERSDVANVHATMFALRLAAGEANVFCCDGAFANIDDTDGFRAEAKMARRLGFIGKTCIHPQQVPLANAVFAVSEGDVAFAQQIVAAAHAAAAQGRGAFAVDGRMIDAPFLQRAEAILAAARQRGSNP